MPPRPPWVVGVRGPLGPPPGAPGAAGPGVLGPEGPGAEGPAGPAAAVVRPPPAPLDPHFQGWAMVQIGKQGQFRFKTILPGAYPASRSWMRPPHIHFKISKLGYEELVTQMYFEGQKLNKLDLLLKRKSEAEQQSMIAKRIKDQPETYRYTIVIQKA